ncbi:hypothetical protein [Frigoribacterium sp. RIT-PI-h]|uniref:hypothetical protein n=1 Tax=Frigoribacterium sp. RIT-PI-h TaxID=1690245 RepID=UPI0006B894C1|nr:hypothetical protein [Frigoribacterium sp. RIT-PI-h]
MSVRFAPTVHGVGDRGFVAALVAVAREKGVSAYPGDGTNRWPAVHRSDAARAVALGLDLAASSEATRRLLGWAPTGPTLLEDLDAGAYGSSR